MTITLVLASLAMIGPFAIDTIFPAFGQVGQDFGVDSSAMQQVTSVYMLAFATMSIFHGPIADAVGRKPVMITGLAGFALANVFAALAPSFGLLLLARFIQGAFAGAATIVSRVVIRDLFAGAEAQKLMAQVMMIFSVAPAIAPILGGWLLTVGQWPLIFWAVAGYALLMIVTVAVLLPETLPVADRQPLRPDNVVRSLLQVATKPALIRISFTMAMGFGGYFIYILGAPIIMLDLLGEGEQDFWKLFIPLIGGMLIGSYLSGRLAGKIPRYRLVTVIMPVTVIAGAINLVLVFISPTLPWAVIGPTLLSVAIGTVFPILNLEILELFPHQRGAAASIGTFASLIFNALVAGAVIPLAAASLVSLAALGLGLSILSALGWWWHVRAMRASGQSPGEYNLD